MSTIDSSIVAEAERWVYRTKLRILEQNALAKLSATAGLAMAELVDGVRSVQVVAVDGVCIGRVRRRQAAEGQDGWFAVPLPPWCAHGPYGTAAEAANALRKRIGSQAITSMTECLERSL